MFDIYGNPIDPKAKDLNLTENEAKFVRDFNKHFNEHLNYIQANSRLCDPICLQWYREWKEAQATKANIPPQYIKIGMSPEDWYLILDHKREGRQARREYNNTINEASQIYTQARLDAGLTLREKLEKIDSTLKNKLDKEYLSVVQLHMDKQQISDIVPSTMASTNPIEDSLK